jgi:hypothetical protein
MDESNSGEKKKENKPHMKKNPNERDSKDSKPGSSIIN